MFPLLNLCNYSPFYFHFSTFFFFFGFKRNFWSIWSRIQLSAKYPLPSVFTNLYQRHTMYWSFNLLSLQRHLLPEPEPGIAAVQQMVQRMRALNGLYQRYSFRTSILPAAHDQPPSTAVRRRRPTTGNVWKQYFVNILWHTCVLLVAIHRQPFKSIECNKCTAIHPSHHSLPCRPLLFCCCHAISAFVGLLFCCISVAAVVICGWRASNSS